MTFLGVVFEDSCSCNTSDSSTGFHRPLAGGAVHDLSVRTLKSYFACNYVLIIKINICIIFIISNNTASSTKPVFGIFGVCALLDIFLFCCWCWCMCVIDFVVGIALMLGNE